MLPVLLAPANAVCALPTLQPWQTNRVEYPPPHRCSPSQTPSISITSWLLILSWASCGPPNRCEQATGHPQ